MTCVDCPHFYVITTHSFECLYYPSRLPSGIFELTPTVDVPGREHDIAKAFEISRHSTSGMYIRELENGSEVGVRVSESEVQERKSWLCTTGRLSPGR